MASTIAGISCPARKRQPRDWRVYNEKLVQRAELSFYLESLTTWDEDLTVLNSEKAGRPFQYPPVLFFLAWILRFLYHLTYRSLEGLLRTLGQFQGFDAPDYTTIYKRCREIDLREWLPQKPLNGPLVLAVDASGIKIDNYSDWMRHVWDKKAKPRRGWIKMNIIVDTATHTALDVKITKEEIGDQQNFIPLVQSCLNQEITVQRVLADGIFDTKEIFQFLARHRILPGIPPRKNASRKSRGCALRAEEVRYYQDYGEKVWKLVHQYSKRPAVERTFSAFKQLFGDHVMARKWENIVHELQSKFWLLNWNLSRPVFFQRTKKGGMKK